MFVLGNISYFYQKYYFHFFESILWSPPCKFPHIVCFSKIYYWYLALTPINTEKELSNLHRLIPSKM